MKITILTDNTAGGKFLAEHGLSYHIEHQGQSLLFDTGHSNVFLKNAGLLGIDIIRDVETIVLSHGHWDHAGGLRFLKGKTLITHPGAFIKRFRKRSKTNIGPDFSKIEIENNFYLNYTTKPFPITGHLIFLGEIPRKNNFEAQSTSFVDENGNDDFVMDDSALVSIVNGELVIISGCAHSGICNTISYAQKVTGVNKIRAVIGGFHLKHNNVQTQKTIEYLQKIGIKYTYPAHCTELPALAAFYTKFNIQQIKTGMVINILK